MVACLSVHLFVPSVDSNRCSQRICGWMLLHLCSASGLIGMATGLTLYHNFCICVVCCEISVSHVRTNRPKLWHRWADKKAECSVFSGVGEESQRVICCCDWTVSALSTFLMLWLTERFSRVKEQQPPPFCGHYTGQPALAGTSSYELEDFVGAKFYCPHALADGNQRIGITEKTLEFSSTVLSTLSLVL